MSKTPSIDTCAACGARCCRHIALAIDTPACKRDYDNIRWFLMHKGVSVFVDHEGDWVLQFVTDCRYLDHGHACTRYKERPRVCRDYPGPDGNCEHLGAHEPHRRLFTCVEQFERYLTRKGVDWRWARHRLSGERASAPRTPSPSRTRRRRR